MNFWNKNFFVKLIQSKKTDGNKNIKNERRLICNKSRKKSNEVKMFVFCILIIVLDDLFKELT